MERSNLKKLNEVEGKEQYRVQIKIGSQLRKTQTLRWILTELRELLEIYNNFCQRESGYYELKKHKP
jgi:hypothetical protein